MEEFILEQIKNDNKVKMNKFDQNVLIHGHCHQKSQDRMKGLKNLLSELNIKNEMIDSSCCGMAGSFGYDSKNYEVSKKMANLSLIPVINKSDEKDFIIANGTSCRHQISDLSKKEGIEQLVAFINNAESEGLDYLINNAGAAWGANYDDFPESGWDKVVDLNLKTPFFLTQQLTSLLEKKATASDPSRVINIASIDGLHVPMMETFSYSASKSGIIHLTKHMAKVLVERNIIVNAIAPGPFDSHMLGKAVNFDYSFIADSVPRKRIGTPDDIAGLCIFLCSRAGAYTVGETITCDGGIVKLI